MEWTADVVTYAVITVFFLSLLVASMLLGEVFDFFEADDGMPKVLNSTLIMAFFTAFGAVGWIIAGTYHINGIVVALLALLGGVVIGVPMGFLQKYMHSAQGTTNYSYADLTGTIGTASLDISPNGIGMAVFPTGNGSTVTMPSRNGTEVLINTGDPVRVVNVIASTAFVVKEN